MAGTSFDSLHTYEGRRAFDTLLADMLRAGRSVQAEALLASHLRGSGRPLPQACRDLSTSDVTLHGWRSLATEGDPVTAIGIDLSTYSENKGQSGLFTPALEVSRYGDAPFPFSTAGEAGILAAWASEAQCPWQGAFEEVGCDLRVDGLDRLYTALRDVRPHIAYRNASNATAPAGPEYADFAVAEWWLMLRLHQALTRDLATVRFERRLPILLGSHGAFPSPRAVLHPSNIGAVGPDPEAAPRPTGKAQADAAFERVGSARRAAPVDMEAKLDLLKQAAERLRDRTGGRVRATDVEELVQAARLVGGVLKRWAGPGGKGS